jgi:transposase
MKMTQHSILTAGIDAAKDKLDVALHGRDRVVTFDNTDPGIAKLADYLKAEAAGRVGIEATGGYERAAVRYLQAQGLSVAVLQPLQVRAFAKLRLQRAKNDRIDARLIAACTHVLDARDKLPPDPRFDALADHLTFIEQIEADAVRIQTRMEHLHDPRQRRIYAGDIKRLEKRAAAERRRLEAELRAHDDLAARLDLVRSIPGIGAPTALAIVVRMPELGQVSREQAAAIAGLAPFVRQSGTFAGQTHIGGGRARLRRPLYMAAFAASARWNPALVALYQRLRARGRSHQAAVIACARKLLIYANTVVQRGKPWEDRTAAA